MDEILGLPTVSLRGMWITLSRLIQVGYCKGNREAHPYNLEDVAALSNRDSVAEIVRVLVAVQLIFPPKKWLFFRWNSSNCPRTGL